jgi:hypothetical protein
MTIFLSIAGSAFATGILNIVDHWWARWAEDRREAKKEKRETATRTRERLAAIVDPLTQLGSILTMRHVSVPVSSWLIQQAERIETARFNVEDVEVRALLERIIGAVNRFAQNDKARDRADQMDNLERLVEEARAKLADLTAD